MKKAIAMISGGIDSPVAAKMMSDKYDIIPVHFVLYPFYCKGSFELTLDTLKRLGFKKIILFPFGPVLSKIAKQERFYRCIMCRKSMFKAAEILVKKEKAEAIITGESLAQKASQTLKNMASTTHRIKIPILQPLLALDKQEIIAISKEMGIFSEKHTGCCTITPDHPVTRAEIAEAEKLFKKLGLDKEIKKQMKKIVVTNKFDEKILKKLI